ncbi:MAG TPA: NDP-sugar synthase [Hyphomicrobiales bacterium]|nr:NDP-sugar synthase [Hyphomicrobiales bacterium]
MHAIILADRFGRELWPLAETRPVCLLPIANKPVLQLTIEELFQLGIRRATVLCSEHASLVSAYFGSGRAFGMDLQYRTVSAPCSVEYAIELARIEPDQDWIAVRGDILRPFGFLEEAMRRGAEAAKSSIFTAMGILVPGLRGAIQHDIRWAAMRGEGSVDPLNLESIAAFHRCNMKALAGEIPGFVLPGRPASGHIAIDQRSVVLAPFIDCRTVIGRNCLIERNVVLGGGAVIGDGSIIDNGAAIHESVILPGSYVGAMEVEHSVVDGSRIYGCLSGAIMDFGGSSLAALDISQSHAEFSIGQSG